MIHCAEMKSSPHLLYQNRQSIFNACIRKQIVIHYIHFPSTSTGWILFYLLCCFCTSISGIFFSITLKNTSALSPAVILERYIEIVDVYSSSWRKNIGFFHIEFPFLLHRCFIYFPFHWQVSLVGSVPYKTTATP